MYISYPDIMQLETRKCYVKDRTQVGIAYIVEYSHTVTLKGENRYHTGMLDTPTKYHFWKSTSNKRKDRRSTKAWMTCIGDEGI